MSRSPTSWKKWGWLFQEVVNCHVAKCLDFSSLAAHGDAIDDALREIRFVVSESFGEKMPKLNV